MALSFLRRYDDLPPENISYDLEQSVLDSTMADQDCLLQTASVSTILGNKISMKMVEFLNRVKEQPAGFRELRQDFMSICEILNSLEESLKGHFKTKQTFPEKAIPELMNVLTKTVNDFTQLQNLLQKFMDYERGGTFAKSQKTWRLVFADKTLRKSGAHNRRIEER